MVILDAVNILVFSFKVSTAATLLAFIISLPVVYYLVSKKHKYSKVVFAIFSSYLAIPAVFVGLLVYMLICSRGPFGRLGILYTPYAIILAQTILAVPIFVVLNSSNFGNTLARIREQLLVLGANNLQIFVQTIKESKNQMFCCLIVAFSRLISEAGLSIIVGGDIKNYTRTLSTAITFETMRGNLELSIILGMMLFVTTLGLNVIFQLLGGYEFQR